MVDGVDADESGGSNSGGSNSGGAGGAASGGSASGGEGSSATGGNLGASGGAQGAYSCKNPVEQAGFVSCDEGYSHRNRITACENKLPRPERIFEVIDETSGSCEYDSDCPGELDFCRVGSSMENPNSYCSTGCLTDSDCGEQRICVCGSGPVGTCAIAECQSDADCATDMRCSSWKSNDGCFTTTTYSCQTKDDSCLSPLDCAEGDECRIKDGKRACYPPEFICLEGRPFLIAGQLRWAPVHERADWQDRLPVPLEHLPGDLRLAIGTHYQRAGQMEHASIAAFARFSLQLLLLGAPASLIEATTTAMADETRHARLCFGIASAYLGRTVGPGPLSIEGALSDQSLENIVRTAIIEGCIGETLAALELAHAAECAQEQNLAQMLADIARDEARHAELAFRFVAWAVQMHPHLASLVADELARIRTQARELAMENSGVQHSNPDPAKSSLDLTSFGVINAAERKRLKQAGLLEVLVPCFESLLKASVLPTSTVNDGVREGDVRG